jgi:putative photosynthetic complex assembly protein
VSQRAVDGGFPKVALLGAAGLVGLSLVAAGVGRLTGVGTTSMPTVPAVEVRDLRFVDEPNGGIAVREAGSDRPIFEVAPGTNGFIRGVLRGLARGRKIEMLDASPPFRMTRWADGRLSIEDPMTARWIDLGAFGPTNTQAFAQIFEARGDMR